MSSQTPEEQAYAQARAEQHAADPEADPFTNPWDGIAIDERARQILQEEQR